MLDDERRLIDRAVDVDADACAAIARANYAAMYRLLVYLTRGDAHLAKDLCQDTFAAAWQMTPIVRGAKSPHGILLRFVKDDSNPERAGYAFVSREGEGEWKARKPMLLVMKE